MGGEGGEGGEGDTRGEGGEGDLGRKGITIRICFINISDLCNILRTFWHFIHNVLESNGILPLSNLQNILKY